MDAAEAFARGVTFEEFTADVSVHQQELMGHYGRLSIIPAELRGSSPLPRVRVLAISDEWCVDNVFNLPVVARLVEASPLATLRVIRRPTCRALADEYPGRGGMSRVPTLLFLNETDDVIGHWSERSASEHRWFEAFTNEHPMPALDIPDGIPAPRLMAWMKLRIASERQRFYDGVWREVVAEICAVAHGDAPDGLSYASATANCPGVTPNAARKRLVR